MLENSIWKLVEGNFICSLPSGGGWESVWLVFIEVNALFICMHGICLTVQEHISLFSNAVYIWGIAVDSVLALLVWIVPSLRKRAEAGRECRLAGMDSPYTGTGKSHLSGMTHLLPKARHIPGAAPPERGQPPLPCPCLRSQAGGAAPGGLLDGILWRP